MPVIIHDAHPDGADDASADRRNKACIALLRTEILRIDLQFRQIYDLAQRCLDAFRNEDRLIEKIIQNIIFIRFDRSDLIIRDRISDFALR